MYGTIFLQFFLCVLTFGDFLFELFIGFFKPIRSFLHYLL